ncbi:MAG: transporter [Saprospiraceae bacterium]|nr:transporter [Saprospiraceae bacterium]
MKNNAYLILMVLLTGVMVYAQNPSEIVTDRPDQTDGAYVLLKNYLQVENGILFNKSGVLNNFMVRYGYSGSGEIRCAVDLGRINSNFSIFPVQFSAKQRLFNQSGAIPLVTLIGYLNFGPIASANVKSNEIEGALLLAFQHELNDAMAFEWNFGSQSFRNDMKFTLLYSYKIFNRATTFVEYFSDFDKSSKPVHNADVGVLYAASHNLSLDIGLGSTLDSSLRKAIFFTMGASYRFLPAD